MHFCYQPDESKQISHEEFERLNCLPVKQSLKSIVFKSFIEQYPNYLHEVLDVTT